MKLNIFSKKIPLPLLLILAAALAMRLIYPNMFISDGDTAGHVLASLRLFHTSLFQFQPPIGNFFFQLFQFRHGFTVMLLPFFSYFIFFKLFGLAISESALVFICAVWGLLSIAAVYLFTRKLSGEKPALLAALLIAFLPVHIGLSRLHTGPQIIAIIFLYLSLYLLWRTVEQPTTKNKIFYFLSLAFYIGADNAFFVGLFLNLALLAAGSAGAKDFLAKAKKIYLGWPSLIFISPILIYAAAAVISVKFGINSGYLLRTFEKVDNGSGYKSFSPDIFILVSVLLAQGGATFLVLLLSLFALKRKINRRILFIALIFLSYFSIFFVSGSWQDAYSVYALVPACILIGALLAEGKKAWLVYLLVLFNFIYSLSIIYNLNVPFQFPPVNIYGSLSQKIMNNDTGGKALAYLVREGKLEASRIIIPGKGGLQKEKIGILAYDDSIPYYTGVENIGDLNFLISSGELEKYGRFLAVVSDVVSSGNNDLIKKFAADNNYGLAAEIYDRKNGKKLLSVYSNYQAGAAVEYYADVLNPLYNKKYENINGLSNVYSGMF